MRERQEDAFAAYDLSEPQMERYLFAVADGMGGHAGAATAAQLCMRRFCDVVRAGGPSLALRLRDALLAANDALTVAGFKDARMQGAGCAFLGVVMENRAAPVGEAHELQLLPRP